MLETFQSLLETKENITEGSLEQTAKRLKNYANQLESMSRDMKSGAMVRNVTQELGSGYKKDFNSIAKSLDDAMMGIEEMLYEIAADSMQ